MSKARERAFARVVIAGSPRILNHDRNVTGSALER
jgi:hypothetical protein